MDLDALAAARAAEWERLELLGRKGALSGTEADELITRYQSAATDLSAIRSAAGQTPLGERLGVLVARARLRFAGIPADPLQALPAFFALQLPAALYRIRWLTLGVVGAFLLITLAYGIWASSSPELMAALGQQMDLDQYADQDFVGYYSDHSGTVFSSTVWTHNALVAVVCVVTGVLGVFGPWMLLQNAQNLGIAAAIMGTHGHLDTFFLYIAPHGQLELYSVFIACAAGLRIFWAWIAPGPRTRGQALAEEARALFTVAVGLVISLLVSGLIEGWVTRQDWPWAIKIGIGTVALAGFLFVQWFIGGRAFRAGQTGDLEEFEAGARRLVAG